MYQLASGPPFRFDVDANLASTSSGETVSLMGEVAQIWGALSCKTHTLEEFLRESTNPSRLQVVLELFKSDQAGRELLGKVLGKETRIAIASCCDEPPWAHELLGKFRVSSATTTPEKSPTLACVCSSTQIYKANKQEHLRKISKDLGEDLGDMIFFDDQTGNCRNVGALGVSTVHTPSGGVTWERVVEGLKGLKEKN